MSLYVNNALHGKHRRRLMMQLDPYRGGNVPRPQGWRDSPQSRLLELVDSYDIERLKFRKLYRQTYPYGLPPVNPDVSEPNSTLPHCPSAVSQEGKNSGVQEREEVGENNDEPGGAADLPSKSDEGINSDNCINICDSEEDEGEEDQQIDPFTNAHPFDSRRMCRDLTLEPSWLPNIAQH